MFSLLLLPSPNICSASEVAVDYYSVLVCVLVGVTGDIKLTGGPTTLVEALPEPSAAPTRLCSLLVALSRIIVSSSIIFSWYKSK